MSRRRGASPRAVRPRETLRGLGFLEMISPWSVLWGILAMSAAGNGVVGRRKVRGCLVGCLAFTLLDRVVALPSLPRGAGLVQCNHRTRLGSGHQGAHRRATAYATAATAIMTEKAKAAMGPVAAASPTSKLVAYPVDEARGVEDLATARLTSLEHELDERCARRRAKSARHGSPEAPEARAPAPRGREGARWQVQIGKDHLTLAGTGITAVVHDDATVLLTALWRAVAGSLRLCAQHPPWGSLAHHARRDTRLHAPDPLPRRLLPLHRYAIRLHVPRSWRPWCSPTCSAVPGTRACVI